MLVASKARTVAVSISRFVQVNIMVSFKWLWGSVWVLAVGMSVLAGKQVDLGMAGVLEYSKLQADSYSEALWAFLVDRRK